MKKQIILVMLGLDNAFSWVWKQWYNTRRV